MYTSRCLCLICSYKPRSIDESYNAITSSLSRMHGEGEPRLMTVVTRRLLHDGRRQLEHVAAAPVHALTPTEVNLGQCHAGLPRLRPTGAITGG